MKGDLFCARGRGCDNAPPVSAVGAGGCTWGNQGDPGVMRDRQFRRGAKRRGLVARAGFTIIELFMVMVVLGILAALMIEHISELKQHAYISTMQSDLRNLETAEEGYFVEFDTYTPSLLPDRYTPSTNDTFTILSASVTGWSAVVTRLNDTGLGTTSCHIAVGTDETTATEWPGAPYCP